MIPFSYSRARDAGQALALASTPGAKFLGGGTNLVDLMRETVERPTALVDVTGLADAIEERAGGRHWPVEEQRARRTPRGANPLPCAFPRDPGRRQRADPQHGDGRRQSAPAHAMHLFLRQ